MRFLSVFLSVLALSGAVSAISSENSRSTVNNAGGYVHADSSLEAGRYEPHAHRMATMAEPNKPLFKYDPFDLAAGPSVWGTLPDSATCGVQSQRQSPVQLPAIWDMKGITKDTTGLLKPLAPAYGMQGMTGLSIVNTGHALQVNIPTGLTLSGGALGSPYTVQQMHMHGRSEHSIGGAQYPLEIHIVHKDLAREKVNPNDPLLLAVLGIMVQESPDGRDNPALTPLTSVVYNAQFNSSINKEGIIMPLNMAFSLTNLLPQNKDYYHYSGSLTTPPCSEQVVWHVMTTPIMASRTQILALTAPFGTTGNSRPTQALNGRPVYMTSWQSPLGTGSASTVSMTLAGIVSVIMTLIQMQ